ncbi:hypothetical protein [Pseudoalteromonas sp.]|uniref:hypothetical protein n=1 Tax=Pseudoalteromonas sp. TaxID=53249 RepID=UPI003569251A
MADNFRVIFVGLAEGIDSRATKATLAAKLNTSEQKIAQFFSGKTLFVPSNKDKALKQSKLLASLGIQSKLQAVSTAATAAVNKLPDSQKTLRDERIFDALDYITSSLIRLEEKLEELEQRLPEIEVTAMADEHIEWQDDDLMLDDDLLTPLKKRSNVLLYALTATVVTLLALLAVYLTNPNLFTF